MLGTSQSNDGHGTQSCGDLRNTWVGTDRFGVKISLAGMRLSLATTGAAFALILVLWTISLLVVLPLLQSDINPSESQYLETCRREYGHCRSERPFERQYSFNPQQPEIDIVYTWVNGSDPAHQRRTRFSYTSKSELSETNPLHA